MKPGDLVRLEKAVYLIQEINSLIDSHTTPTLGAWNLGIILESKEARRSNLSEKRTWCRILTHLGTGWVLEENLMVINGT